MIIGVAGHRPNRLHVGAARVRTRLREVLTVVRQTAARVAPGPFVAISPMAEGADRLFAEVALELDYELWALLPFRSSDFELTFAEASAIPEYRALLGRSARIVELNGSPSDRNSAYEALGQDMVERCRLLVAVWDGRPAAGRGGTTAVIHHALREHRPVIWINSAVDRPAVLLRSIDSTDTAIALDLETLCQALCS